MRRALLGTVLAAFLLLLACPNPKQGGSGSSLFGSQASSGNSSAPGELPGAWEHHHRLHSGGFTGEFADLELAGGKPVVSFWSNGKLLLAEPKKPVPEESGDWEVHTLLEDATSVHHPELQAAGDKLGLAYLRHDGEGFRPVFHWVDPDDFSAGGAIPLREKAVPGDRLHSGTVNRAGPASPGANSVPIPPDRLELVEFKGKIRAVVPDTEYLYVVTPLADGELDTRPVMGLGTFISNMANWPGRIEAVSDGETLWIAGHLHQGSWLLVSGHELPAPEPEEGFQGWNRQRVLTLLRSGGPNNNTLQQSSATLLHHRGKPAFLVAGALSQETELWVSDSRLPHQEDLNPKPGSGGPAPPGGWSRTKFPDELDGDNRTLATSEIDGSLWAVQFRLATEPGPAHLPGGGQGTGQQTAPGGGSPGKTPASPPPVSSSPPSPGASDEDSDTGSSGEGQGGDDSEDSSSGGESEPSASTPGTSSSGSAPGGAPFSITGEKLRVVREVPGEGNGNGGWEADDLAEFGPPDPFKSLSSTFFTLPGGGWRDSADLNVGGDRVFLVYTHPEQQDLRFATRKLEVEE